MEDVPLPGNPYSQQLTRVDIYGGPHVAPLSISLNLGLVDGHHPPMLSLNIDGYLLQLLNPQPNSLMTTWHNPQHVGYVPIAQASHVQQDRPNLQLQRKPINPEQTTILKGFEEPLDEDHLPKAASQSSHKR